MLKSGSYSIYKKYYNKKLNKIKILAALSRLWLLNSPQLHHKFLQTSLYKVGLHLLPPQLEGGQMGEHWIEYLIWGSLEDAGTLIEGVGPEAVLLTLQLLCCSVQRLGYHATIRNLTLDRDKGKGCP